MMSSIDCTRQSIQRQTNCSIQVLNQPRTQLLLSSFSRRLTRNTTFPRRCFSLMAHTRCKLPVTEAATISDMKNMEIGMRSNVSFVRINAEMYASRVVSATPQQRQPTTGSVRSVSHGIGLSDHYRYYGGKILIMWTIIFILLNE